MRPCEPSGLTNLSANWLFLVLLGLFGQPAVAAGPTQLVVPAPNAAVPGDTGNRFPFAPIEPAIPQSMRVPRYQQVYDDDALSSIMGLPIGGIAFRVDNLPYGDVPG